MNIRLTIHWVAFCALVAATGCRKYVVFDGDDRPPRTVVNGVMHAHQPFEAHVSNSRGYTSIGGLSDIVNAQVRVYNAQGVRIDSLVHISSGRYEGTQVALPGNEYTVKVRSPFGEVQATDRVPGAVPILNWDTVRIPIPDAPFISTMEISITITDPGQEANWYYLEVLNGLNYIIEWVFNPNSGSFEPDTIFFDEAFFDRATISTADPLILSENDAGIGETRIWSRGLTFTDQLFNGTTRTFSIRMESFFTPSTLIVRLHHTSPELWRYIRTANRFLATEGDPFAEPVPVYTNVRGGLGMWGATHVSEVEIQVWE
jgi:hypothetical protein